MNATVYSTVRRGWLRTTGLVVGIALVMVVGCRGKQPLTGIAARNDPSPHLSGEDELLAVWESEWQRAILDRGLKELKEETRTDPQTVRALEMLAFENLAVEQVAEALNMSVNAVYLAKHRALRRLRLILHELEEIF